MKPKRIQLSRAKGWRMPPNTVKVDRTTNWGNPHTLKSLREEMDACGMGMSLSLQQGVLVERFKEYCPPGSPLAEAARRVLRGKDLACWCKLDQPCHADVLLELANE